MEPVRSVEGVFAFDVLDGLSNDAEPGEIARALRRALLARVQEVLGARATLPDYVSGHDGDGGPAQDAHLSFAYDPVASRLMVIAPHLVERREPSSTEMRLLQLVENALHDFCELRAGRSGLLSLGRTLVDFDADPLFVASRKWRTVTPYVVTRHAKSVTAQEALEADLREECRRRMLPRPASIAVRSSRGVPRVGLLGEIELVFEQAVRGPVLLGRDRHFGGGLFARHEGAELRRPGDDAN